MKKVKYSAQDMAALIGEVEDYFNTMTKSQTEATDLQKSESVEQPKVEETQPVEAAQETSFGYDEQDIKEMNDMYSSMTKSEAEAHFEALKKALSKENETPAQAEEKVVAKSEPVAEEKPATNSDETKLLKSEIETLKSEKEQLEKSFKDLTAKLVEFVKGSKAPKQKAVTKLEYIAKSEDEIKTETKTQEDVSKLDKSEISRRLTAKIRSGKLEKSEKEKINAFYESGSKNIESIRHLLTGGN